MNKLGIGIISTLEKKNVPLSIRGGKQKQVEF